MLAHTPRAENELSLTFIWLCIFIGMLYTYACTFTDTHTEVFLEAKWLYSPFSPSSGPVSRLIVCRKLWQALWCCLMKVLFNVKMQHWPFSGTPLLMSLLYKFYQNPMWVCPLICQFVLIVHCIFVSTLLVYFLFHLEFSLLIIFLFSSFFYFEGWFPPLVLLSPLFSSYSRFHLCPVLCPAKGVAPLSNYLQPPCVCKRSTNLLLLPPVSRITQILLDWFSLNIHQRCVLPHPTTN